MIKLHAQPYDLHAGGFYFDSTEDYEAKAKANRNEFDEPVEEYEIQFIDGDDLDCELAEAWGLYQNSFAAYLDVAASWDGHDKRNYIIAVGECGYDHQSVADDPGGVDIQLYECASMRELAEQFVDEGLFGEIPERLQFYIDYDAIARDLAVDHSEITIAGTHFIFYCA